jgi:hypothetical protein
MQSTRATRTPDLAAQAAIVRRNATTLAAQTVVRVTSAEVRAG